MLPHEVQASVPSPSKTHATSQSSRSGKMLTLVTSVPASHCHKQRLREQSSPACVCVCVYVGGQPGSWRCISPSLYFSVIRHNCSFYYYIIYNLSLETHLNSFVKSQGGWTDKWMEE